MEAWRQTEQECLCGLFLCDTKSGGRVQEWIRRFPSLSPIEAENGSQIPELINRIWYEQEHRNSSARDDQNAILVADPRAHAAR